MKKVGHVTEDERDQIKALFDRKNVLIELSKSLTSCDSELYERLIDDMKTTNVAFQAWWNNMGEKYHWESEENGQWRIDFKSCDIYLQNNTEEVK